MGKIQKKTGNSCKGRLLKKIVQRRIRRISFLGTALSFIYISFMEDKTVKLNHLNGHKSA